MADKLLPALLDKEHISALRAFFVRRHIPRHEIAVGVPFAGIENAAVLSGPDDKLCSALRAGHAYRLEYLLCILTLRIIGAGNEIAVSAVALQHITAAERAELPGLFRRSVVLFDRLSVLVKRLCVPALGIVRAGGEFSEAPLLHNHPCAALFADYVGLLLGNDDLVL